MRKAEVYVKGILAGFLIEESASKYIFKYDSDYNSYPISLTMPVENKVFEFESFPPFFDGLLPEGFQLQALLRKRKFDSTDYFSQLLAIGEDMVGGITVKQSL
jgi:serine/threonine-protein kinase HipA